MDTPDYRPLPEIRGPLISMLTQFYIGADEPTRGDDVDLPHDLLSIMDLTFMFLQYVRETEAEHGGDFQEWLQRAAREPYLPGDDPSASP